MNKVIATSVLALSFGTANAADVLYTVDPVKVEQPSKLSTYSSTYSKAEKNYRQEQLDTYWSDPEANHVGAMNVTKAKDIAITNRVTRVGIVDGGFVNNDDVKYVEGYNFMPGETGPNYEEREENRTSQCDWGHGQGVAAIIGGNPSSSTRIQGIANVELVAAKAMTCRVGEYQSIADSINWLIGGESPDIPTISKPVDVINISMSGEALCHASIQEAVNKATEKNIMVIVGTGNDNVDAKKLSPQSCNGVINVTSTSLSGHKSYFANYGLYTDMTAFGDSLALPSILDPNNDGVFDYQYVGGTSFAAPMVTGIVALLLNENPKLTKTELQTILTRSARKVTDSGLYTGNHPTEAISCDDGRCGFGIVDAHQAILEMRKITNEGVALKNPLADECDLDFYIDTLGQAYDVCSMGEFKLGNQVGNDHTKIELYKVPSNEELTVDVATFIDSTTKGSYMFTRTSNDNLAYRICEKDHAGTYQCVPETLTPLSTNHLDRPAQCTN